MCVTKYSHQLILVHIATHGLWTSNKSINQKNLKIANVVDKICFGRT